MAAKKSGGAGKAGGSKSAPKQTSSKVSTVASGILSGRIKPTAAQMKAVAASALGQDQTKGQGKKK
jgi:hypothetical protein